MLETGLNLKNTGIEISNLNPLHFLCSRLKSFLTFYLDGEKILFALNERE